MTAADLARAFGCPESVACAMARDATPLLTAVKRVGALRVRWAAKEPPANGSRADAQSVTNWLLDGRPATVGRIMATAEALP